MISLDPFQKSDVYIDYPFEDAKFRWEKQTKKVFKRRYGEREFESHYSSDQFRDAISAGKLISREDYYRD